MPFKHNAAYRHNIPKQKFRVTNWPVYEAGLRQRGSLTFWVDEEVLAAWHAPRRKTPGGQPRYSDLAMQTSLQLGQVFKVALRQVEGLVTSLFQLMGVDLPVPDHTTLSRRCGQLQISRKRHDDKSRDGDKDPGSGKPLHIIIDSTGLKIYEAGQWLEEKSGVKSRRQWRKLHIALDADGGDVIAQTLTDHMTSDISQLQPLLDQIDRPIACLTADGAYDGEASYATIRRHSASAVIIIPPPPNSTLSDIHGPPNQRAWHIRMILEQGRLAWQAATDYGIRSRVEATMDRFKSGIGNWLRTRSIDNQKVEIALGCDALNRMRACARPNCIRVTKATA